MPGISVHSASAKSEFHHPTPIPLLPQPELSCHKQTRHMSGFPHKPWLSTAVSPLFYDHLLPIQKVTSFAGHSEKLALILARGKQFAPLRPCRCYVWVVNCNLALVSGFLAPSSFSDPKLCTCVNMCKKRSELCFSWRAARLISSSNVVYVLHQCQPRMPPQGPVTPSDFGTLVLPVQPTKHKEKGKPTPTLTSCPHPNPTNRPQMVVTF